MKGPLTFLSGSRYLFRRLRNNLHIRSRTYHNNNKMTNIVVEGNIGSGKTTFLEYFNNMPGIQVVEEPIDSWRNVKGHNVFGLMYQDATRWSLTFQTYVQLTMVQMRTRKQTHPTRLMERSIYSAKYCFVENLYRSGKMPDCEYAVLTEWFDWLISNIDLKMDLMVYLRTSPENCLKRIKERHRSEETGISLQYLQVLDKLHDEWLIENKYFPLPSPVLVLDGNLELPEMLKMFEKNCDKILMQNNDSRNGGRVQVNSK
ncbi:thymidine kinase 2, mitochondrial-like [Saccoglossus kowalevskii]|uniref:Thymidine kinase 2, mitochondrial-like n=1 Tax=Saccoglossus kowalevskii TaxID=10224 RepID=A0ABM0H0X3_SACKO|nr:PREDICTED: thymidine kinase 2, mitochondrial-like [Saccoglossus kowalevskii]